MAAPIYRFYIQIESGTKTLCHPIWKSNTSIDYALESGQKFHRKSLSSKLDFIGEDYDLLMTATYEEKVNFYMEISTDMGLTWSQYWQGIFSRTDCTINYDDRKISVQPEAVDEYKAILDGLEKEFNLVELAPQTDRIILAKRPLIQTYISGDTIVSCFLSGNAWEEEAEETTSTHDLKDRYHFTLNTILKEIEVTTEDGLVDAIGTYAGRVVYDAANQYFSGTLYQQNSGTYKILIRQEGLTVDDMTWTLTIVDLVDENDTQCYYKTFIDVEFDTLDFNMNARSGYSGTMQCSMVTRNVWARLLCDVERFDNYVTSAIPDDDIVINNRNYRRCVGYSVPIAYISNLYSDNPTKYGRRDDGKYFLPPYSIGGDKYFPIAQSTWRYASYWFKHNDADERIDKRARKQYYLRDAYLLADCIQVLLIKLGTGLTHQATSDYSQFLYADPNPISGNHWQLYITQKTNILKGEYTEPARKAEASLNVILKMLQQVFGVYWFVDSSNRLRLEHISWYKNGGAYGSDVRQVGYDLTTRKNTRNGLPWCYGQSEISFDKFDMPSQYTYGWMDEVTTGFVGLPINVKSPNAQADKIEEVSIGNFTSDVDYMLLCPSECSQDGFALLAAVNANALLDDDSGGYPGFYGSHGEYGVNDNISTPLYDINTDMVGGSAIIHLDCDGNGSCNARFFDANGDALAWTSSTITDAIHDVVVSEIPEGAVKFGFVMAQGSLDFNVFKIEMDNELELPFIKKRIEGVDYTLQNGYMAMVYLQPKYLTYDMPSLNIEVNGSDTTADGIMRKAKHTLTFPSDAVDVDTKKIVKTSVGFGEVNNLSLTLSSRIIKATLNYDNNI